MNCDVVAFLTKDLFEASEEPAWKQAVAGASFPGVEKVFLMPDTHLGAVVPIGSVIVTDGTLILAGAGFDISCGVLAMKVPGLHASDVVDPIKRRQWIDEVEKRVPTGIGSHRPALMPTFTKNQAEQALHFGAASLGVDPDCCERPYIPLGTLVNPGVNPRSESKLVDQLGSLGGGNHFIEMQVDAEDGSVWAMIHSGSRGYGYGIAAHYMHAAAALRGLPDNRREEAWVSIDEPLGREYWDQMCGAANFAIANRHVMARSISEAFEETFGVAGKTYYEISHNLIQQEQVDGQTRMVHRKGATRAFSAGHPMLVDNKWYDTGHPVIIPGSMFTGGAILRPRAGAKDTAYSVNHGSGRVMGRKDAKRRFTADQEVINLEMNEVVRNFANVPITGILSNQRQIPLDECGRVYKSLDAVLETLYFEGIATVEHRLFPVASIKGND
jgi:tRNA-splicing ligase RtcB